MTLAEKIVLSLTITFTLGVCGYFMVENLPTPNLAPTIANYTIHQEFYPEEEELPPESAEETSPEEEAPTGPLDINTATLEELDALPNIGEQRAQDIIDYRTAQGNFNNIEEIMAVSGIGEGIFDNLKDLIMVAPVEELPPEEDTESSQETPAEEADTTP